jgi:hypothetical protein
VGYSYGGMRFQLQQGDLDCRMHEGLDQLKIFLLRICSLPIHQFSVGAIFAASPTRWLLVVGCSLQRSGLAVMSKPRTDEVSADRPRTRHSARLLASRCPLELEPPEPLPSSLEALPSPKAKTPKASAIGKAVGKVASKAAGKAAGKSSRKAAAEQTHASRAREEAAWAEGVPLVVGCDEAGRGPLAGPVVAAACALPSSVAPIPGVGDSKTITDEAAREALYAQIVGTPGVVWSARVNQLWWNRSRHKLPAACCPSLAPCRGAGVVLDTILIWQVVSAARIDDINILMGSLQARACLSVRPSTRVEAACSRSVNAPVNGV